MEPYREKAERGTKEFPFLHIYQQLKKRMIKLHWHPEIEIIYSTEGEVLVTVSEEKHILTEGDILFINPEELHSYVAITPYARYHAAVFDVSLIRHHENHFLNKNFVLPLMNGDLSFTRKIEPGHEKYEEIRSVLKRMFEEDGAAGRRAVFGISKSDSLLFGL